MYHQPTIYNYNYSEELELEIEAEPMRETVRMPKISESHLVTGYREAAHIT